MAVSTEPIAARQASGELQVLVAEEASFRLKGENTKFLRAENGGRTYLRGWRLLILDVFYVLCCISFLEM